MLQAPGPGINDYNQLQGIPLIRQGNWFEERALHELTGKNRGSTKPENTSQRCVTHTRSTSDWSTSTGTVHSATATILSQTPVSSLPRKSHEVEKKSLQLAQEIYLEQKEAGERQREAENDPFRNREPFNRTRILEVKDGRSTYSLDSPAITIYASDNNFALGMGMTAPQTRNTFGRSSEFSKPIQEYLGSESRVL